MATKPTYEELEQKSDSDIMNRQQPRLKSIIFGLVFFWTAVIAFSTVWDIHARKATTREMASKEAHAHFDKDQTIRYWASKHGGIYVYTDLLTPPNPYLRHVPERDITTPAGKKLTLMNPAYMVRQLNKEFVDLYNIIGHITSLKSLRPENEPILGSGMHSKYLNRV